MDKYMLYLIVGGKGWQLSLEIAGSSQKGGKNV